MPAPKAKYVNLDTLLDSNKRVFVKNTSRPMGHIVLTFISAQGRPIARPIPRTWIPVCLTDTVSPSDIRNSSELRKFINSGILTLIDPEEATKILESEDARDEEKRLNLSEFSARSAATSRIQAMEGQRQYAPSVNTGTPIHDNVVLDPVNSRVKATLLQVEAKDLTERDAVAQFRVMEAELTQHDLTYILSQAQNDGALRRFAQQVFAELSAAVETDVIYRDGDDDEVDPPEDQEALAAARRNQRL